MINWRQLPEMRPYLSGEAMPLADGSTKRPNSLSTPNNLTILAHYYETLKPQRTLEIGLAFGASATLLLSLHRSSGGGQHHAIDPFQLSDWGDAAVTHIRNNGLDGQFTLHREASAVVLPRLLAAAERFDLIYIDGSHLFEDVFVDFYFADKLLNLGGLIALDDSSHPHVAKVVKFVRRNFAASYREESPYPITAAKWPRMRTLAARLLGRQQLTLFRKTSDQRRDWGTRLIDF